MKTTLNKIRSYNPCAGGWARLLHHLCKTRADDKPVSIATIVKSNGINDALWCLRAVEGYDREIRLFAVWCVRQAQHLMKDPRSIAAINVAERFALGKATAEELESAMDAAMDAARAATGHTDNLAARAAVAATLSFAGTSRAAATDAARHAAMAAAWSAAKDTEAAAPITTRRAADDARTIAWYTSRYKQEVELLRRCAEVEAREVT